MTATNRHDLLPRESAGAFARLIIPMAPINEQGKAMTEKRIIVTGQVAADSAFQKSFRPKSTGAQLDSPKIDVKGSVQPKAVPVESKNVAPPSKDD